MSAASLRTFLAVDLPPEALATAALASQSLRAVAPEGVRWTDPESLHLTLKFLGEVPEQRLPRLLERARAKLAPLEPFRVSLAGLGAFPNAREARVLWLGVAQGARELARAARQLDAAASGVGVERERRPYQAHLTLGRLRAPGRVALERAAPPQEIAFPVEEVILYESRLGSGGARYVPLARLPLARPTDTDIEELPPAELGE